MKRFLIYIIIILFPLIVIFTVNIVVDSKAFVNKSFIDKFVDDLNNNDLSVYIFKDLPERTIVRKRIETHRGQHFNKIVLGSSRLMIFGRLIDERVFNISISGAGLEDYEMLLAFLDSNSITFDTIVISADPWILNINHGDTQYTQYNQDVTMESIKELFSWRYFFETVKLKKYDLWDGNENDYIRVTDGSIRYGIEYRNHIPDLAKYVTKDSIYRLNKFESIDNKYAERFSGLISKLSKEHFIELLLIPYHPNIYNALVNSVPIINKVEEVFYNYTGERITVKGSYDAGKLGFDSTYFYDAMHIKEHGLKKLYNVKRN